MKKLQLWGFALLALLGSSIPALAQDVVKGSMFALPATSRLWYPNNGGFVSSGWASAFVPEISYKDFYAGAYMAVPWQNSIGQELDLRVGKNTDLGFAKLDTRVAWYHFQPSLSTVLDIANARAVMSRTFNAGFEVTPYAIFDAQRVLDGTDSTYLAVALGAAAKIPIFGEEIGGPVWRLDAVVWQYMPTVVFAGRHPTIASLTTELGFKLTDSFEVGPRVTLGLNSVNDDGLLRATVSLAARIKFN